jgi:hypothetical protein
MRLYTHVCPSDRRVRSALVDTLSAALGTARVGRANACWVIHSGPWGMRHPAMPVSGFHILVRGTAWLITSTGSPRALRPGDVVLSPSGAEHGLSHAPCRLEQLPPAVLQTGTRDDEACDAAFLCGAYWLDHGKVHHYLKTLPDVIVISPDYDRDTQLRSLVDMFGAAVSDASPGSAITRPALLDLLLTHVVRQWLDDPREARPRMDGAAARRHRGVVADSAYQAIHVRRRPTTDGVHDVVAFDLRSSAAARH